MDPPSSLGYVALGAGEVFFYTNNDTQSTTISGPVGTRIVLYDLDPNATQSDVTYVRGLNLIASRTDKGVVTYYHYNAHGDVVQLTDSTGALVKNYEYDAFGVEENADEDDANPFRYCGEQFDTETGDYYLRARYYTPGAGRFTQEDPIRDGLNWYAYCAGNPVMRVDPSGLVPYAAIEQNCYVMSPDGSQKISVELSTRGNLVPRNENSGYDREIAVAYAHRWYNSRNSEFYDYTKDCANFVSQALYFGGLEMTDEWHSYNLGAKSSFDIRSLVWDKFNYDWDVGAEWRLAAKQYEYFSNADNGYINGEVITISNVDEIANISNNFGVQPGDLMYFSKNTYSAPHHATLIDKVGNGKIYYSGHTSSRRLQDLAQSLGNEVVFIVRIKDDAN